MYITDVYLSSIRKYYRQKKTLRVILIPLGCILDTEVTVRKYEIESFSQSSQLDAYTQYTPTDHTTDLVYTGTGSIRALIDTTQDTI